MTRVVLDTNVFVSAFLFGGKPRLILDWVEQGRIALCYSAPMRTEVEVLAEKFHWRPEMIDFACGPYWTGGLRVKPRRQIQACSDPDDDHVLECAVEAQAEFIVTGDKHLLNMSPFEQILILTPAQFLRSMLPVGS